jgi:ABC-2 type transport system permease protein
VSGLLVPVSLLPGWVEPLSWVLAPTWGVRAVRDSAIGGDPLLAIAMCLLLSAVYVVVGWFALSNFERLARKQATLSLT